MSWTFANLQNIVAVIWFWNRNTCTHSGSLTVNISQGAILPLDTKICFTNIIQQLDTCCKYCDICKPTGDRAFKVRFFHNIILNFVQNDILHQSITNQNIFITTSFIVHHGIFENSVSKHFNVRTGVACTSVHFAKLHFTNCLSAST